MNLKTHMKTQLIDNNTGEVICGCGCGTILEEKIANGSYSERQRDASPITAKRAGQTATLALHDQGLSTVMGDAKTDFNGNKLNIENLQLFYRLNQLNNESIISHDPQSRRLIKPLQEIQLIGTKMALPPGIIKQAQYILHKSNSKKITNHCVAAQVAAVCLFLACRISGSQRKMEEFIQISGRKKWGFYRLIQRILESLDLKLQTNDPVKLVPIIARQIHTDNDIEEFAIRILQEAQAKGWGGGKSPFGVAGAAIFVSAFALYGPPGSENKISTLKLAAATGLSQPSISNTVKELEAILN